MPSCGMQTGLYLVDLFDMPGTDPGLCQPGL